MLQVTSNVMEVDQHVSQYQECIETMENRIQELERQLQLRGDSEGDRVCSELRSLLKEEKKIRFVSFMGSCMSKMQREREGGMCVCVCVAGKRW